MKRLVPVVAMLGFLVYPGVYIFVYLFRAFRGPEPLTDETVQIWHGDPMIRAVLVAVLFLIGLVILLFLLLTRSYGLRGGTLRLRADQWAWLERLGDETHESPERIVERAVALYRDRLEGVGERR